MRGKLARLHYHAECNRRAGAATALQRISRGGTASRRYAYTLRMVVLLQAQARLMVTQRDYLKGKEATVQSQALIRRTLQRLKFRREKAAAVKLQV